MRKFVDWEQVEAETSPGTETCECTRTKIQSLIDSVMTFLGKGAPSPECDEAADCCDDSR